MNGKNILYESGLSASTVQSPPPPTVSAVETKEYAATNEYGYTVHDNVKCFDAYSARVGIKNR